MYALLWPIGLVWVNFNLSIYLLGILLMRVFMHSLGVSPCPHRCRMMHPHPNLLILTLPPPSPQPALLYHHPLYKHLAALIP